MHALKNILLRMCKVLSWRRVLAVLGLSLAAWIVVVLGLMVIIFVTGEQNQAQPADVIVVLGSGLRRNGSPGDALLRRSIWASQLYHEGFAPAVICTGGTGDRQRRSEADACAEVLRNHGIPEDAIYLEDQSRSTEENAIYAHQIMAQQGWNSAVIVTDSFHMLRAHWIFAAQEGDFVHYPSPVPRSRMRWNWYIRHFTREIAALHWQAFKEFFNLPVTYVAL